MTVFFSFTEANDLSSSCLHSLTIPLPEVFSSGKKNRNVNYNKSKTEKSGERYLIKCRFRHRISSRVACDKRRKKKGKLITMQIPRFLLFKVLWSVLEKRMLKRVLKINEATFKHWKLRSRKVWKLKEECFSGLMRDFVGNF